MIFKLFCFHTCFQSVPDNISGKAVQTAENLQSDNHHDKMIEDETKIKQPDISVVSHGENA